MSRIELRGEQFWAVFGPWEAPLNDARQKFRSDWIHQCKATTPPTPFVETTIDGTYTLSIPLNDALCARPISPDTQRAVPVEA